MRYREVIINGQVFLEIVEDHEDRERAWREREQSDYEKDDNSDNGTWIGELVPYQ